MDEPRYDVVGLGNALVDVIAHADDAFLETHGLDKGTMTLIDAARARELYEAMPAGIEVSGGSCANTMAAFASLGGRGAYVGKVSGDQLGDVFRHDIRAAGVQYDVAVGDRAPTGRCLVLVTPDAQRTMQTYLGASSHLGPGDVDVALVSAARVTYLEGYLWDPPDAKEAFRKAAAHAHRAGRKVALTLSDPFCVDRHRPSFLELIEGAVDILFANEAEILSLYEVRSFEDALQRVRGHCEVAALTRSERGSVIVAGDDVHAIDAEPHVRVIDTTGAGDAYAAGFLYGYTQGRPLAACGRIGGIAAAEVISHFGARPETSLAALVRDRLG